MAAVPSDATVIVVVEVVNLFPGCPKYQGMRDQILVEGAGSASLRADHDPTGKNPHLARQLTEGYPCLQPAQPVGEAAHPARGLRHIFHVTPPSPSPSPSSTEQETAGDTLPSYPNS